MPLTISGDGGVTGLNTVTSNVVEFSGNVSVAGTVTYEDVTNVDSVGIITARSGVRINTGGIVVTTGVSTFTTGPVLIGSGTSTGTASQPLQVTGGAYVGGNVGFGTTNSDARLSLQSGGDIQLTFKNTSGVTKAYVGTDGAFGSASTDDLRIRSEGSNIIFGFSGTEKLRLDSNGNLGINNTPWTGVSNAFNHTTMVGKAVASGSLSASTWVSTSLTLIQQNTYVFAKIIAIGTENNRNNGFREYLVLWNTHNGWSVTQLVTANQGNDYGLVDLQMSGTTVQVKAANNASNGIYRLFATYYLF